MPHLYLRVTSKVAKLSFSQTDNIFLENDEGMQGFEFFRYGFCRPASCDKSTKSCRTNGFSKRTRNVQECLSACGERDDCIGFAWASEESRETSNVCFVYGSSAMKMSDQWQAQVESFYDIGDTNSDPNVKCFTRISSSNASKQAQISCQFKIAVKCRNYKKRFYKIQ